MFSASLKPFKAPAPKVVFVFLSFALALTGCASPADLYPPEEKPPFLRHMKALRLYGYEESVATGFTLNAGDLVTVIASKDHFHNLVVGNILSRVGKNREILFWTSSWVKSGLTFASAESGRLSFELKKSFGFKGSPIDFFEIWVFVWNTKDYEEITDFLYGLREMHPHHAGISDALEQASALKRLQAAKNELSKDLAATQKTLEELRREPEKKSPAGQRAEKEKRVKKLEDRISVMTARLTDLEELSQKLLAQRELTAELTQKVEALEKRGKEYLAKSTSLEGLPPMILIASPEDGHEVQEETIILSGVAEDDQGIGEIAVYLNGLRVPSPKELELQLGSKSSVLRSTFDFTLKLRPGDNQVRVSARDTFGLSAEKVLAIRCTPSRRKVQAVVIGINDYPRLPKLKYAVNDALAFKQMLVEKNRVPDENISLLLNEQATLRNVRSALGTGLKNTAGMDDMAIIFFAGHGATERDALSPDGDGLEKYILTHDSDSSDLFSTALPMRDIAMIFDRIRSQRLIFVADACYSGASGGRTVGTEGMRATISDTFLDRLAAGRGKVILTASAANEVSIEKDELQHGVFTYYLLEGLKGAADLDRDGMVTVDEAYRYVSEKVPRATGQEQHPVKKGEVEGSIVLSITR
ncbi:MAG: caspase family protein [Desulfobacterales bacterium]